MYIYTYIYIYIYSFNYTLVREHPIAFFKSLKLKEIEKMEYLIKAKQCGVSNRVFVVCFVLVWFGGVEMVRQNETKY